MPSPPATRRAQLWMESLGDWAWPGTARPEEVLPPPWVPALPPRLEPVLAADGGGQGLERGLRLPHTAALTALAGGLAAAAAAVAVNGPAAVERLVGYAPASAPPPAVASSTAPPPPALRLISSDSAGSTIDGASYHSAALGTSGSFLVYLPPGYADSVQRYPVLYLLHGDNQPDTAFLQVGLQATLDRLISSHAIPPMIAVMVQGGRGPNNWRWGYESYVLEVQQLVDRMLATDAARGSRAIAGDSMGGYGAMNIALGNPYRFGVVESWLGFFNGLEGELRGDRPVLRRLGLHAFVYGAEGDHITDPYVNAPFAAALRAEGASAESAVYPGGHSLETVEAHLEQMLLFAGHALAEQAPTAEAARVPR